jgi:hypothetical protein
MDGVNATTLRAPGCPAVTWVDSPIYLCLADWASGVQASCVHDELGPGNPVPQLATCDGASEAASDWVGPYPQMGQRDPKVSWPNGQGGQYQLL